MSNTLTSRVHLLEENQRLNSELAELERATEMYTSELKINEERFILAMQGANAGLWDWNLETDRVYYSPHWKSMLGYEVNELDDVLKTWKKLVHPDDRGRVLDTVNAYLSGHTNSFEAEMRMLHKEGYEVRVLSRAFSIFSEKDKRPIRLVGTHIDISERRKAEAFNKKTSEILEMIARGKPTSEIYDAIALIYEGRHFGMRCSMLELKNGRLMHGGAPSLPKEYCDAVHGLKNGPDVGSCGTSTFTGKRCLVENIETDPKWNKLKDAAIPHGMRSCWSEPIINARGEVLGAFGMYHDFPALPNEAESDDLKSAARLAGIVMERDHDQKLIRQLAYTDELTGLATRAHFYLYMENLIKVSKRHERRFSILYIDLDNFKQVNDSLGHDVGDLLLKEISRRIGEIGREIDFVTRLSGDEFCIVIEDDEDSLSAGNLSQRCLESIAMPIYLSGRVLTPTCSIGIAHYPVDGESLSSLLKAADTALYSAKENGKNCYAFYEPQLTEKAEFRYKFEQYLREAIEKHQLALVYQPQINTFTGEIVGVEVLSRWHHPKLGHVSPLEFIAGAERIGMLEPLTRWVLETACKQAVAWKKEGFQPLRMAFNITPSQFFDNAFEKLLEEVIQESGIDPGEVQLEVAEGVVKIDQVNLSIFQHLKSLGVLLAIDNYGTGYSSFSSLKHLDVDCLKIDKCVIDDILLDSNTKIIITTMVEIGHNLGYEIVAEGVDDIEQFRFIQELGVKTVQGFLFSKPVSAKELPKLTGRKYLI